MSCDARGWQAWCDGTASPNPGRIGIGVVLLSPDGQHHEISRATGRSGCNNEAELYAIAAALDLAGKFGVKTLTIHSDSRFAVDCLNGIDDTDICRLAELLAATKTAFSAFDAVFVRWLPRHRNAQADQAARAALGLAPKTPALPHRKRHR